MFRKSGSARSIGRLHAIFPKPALARVLKTRKDKQGGAATAAHAMTSMKEHFGIG